MVGFPLCRDGGEREEDRVGKFSRGERRRNVLWLFKNWKKREGFPFLVREGVAMFAEKKIQK